MDFMLNLQSLWFNFRATRRNIAHRSSGRVHIERDGLGKAKPSLKLFFWQGCRHGRRESAQSTLDARKGPKASEQGLRQSVSIHPTSYDPALRHEIPIWWKLRAGKLNASQKYLVYN
jgi:hypothetical protein